MSEPVDLPRRLTAEAIGTAFLLATVVGSGIMGETLAGGNVASSARCDKSASSASSFVRWISLASRRWRFSSMADCVSASFSSAVARSGTRAWEAEICFSSSSWRSPSASIWSWSVASCARDSSSSGARVWVASRSCWWRSLRSWTCWFFSEISASRSLSLAPDCWRSGIRASAAAIFSLSCWRVPWPVWIFCSRSARSALASCPSWPRLRARSSACFSRSPISRLSSSSRVRAGPESKWWFGRGDVDADHALEAVALLELEQVRFDLRDLRTQLLALALLGLDERVDRAARIGHHAVAHVLARGPEVGAQLLQERLRQRAGVVVDLAGRREVVAGPDFMAAEHEFAERLPVDARAGGGLGHEPLRRKQPAGDGPRADDDGGREAAVGAKQPYADAR